MTKSSKEQQLKLLALVKEAIERDQQLRGKYQIGEKFRFVRERLHHLLVKLEQDMDALDQQEKKVIEDIPKDEVIIYVYLFNAHGLDLRSWMKMLTPKIFYEHSVNRPVYLDKSFVEAFIRSKQNKLQHGYLTVGVSDKDIIQRESGKDSLGHQLAKIKEGTLSFTRLVSFTHNEHVYTVNAEGEIVKKH